MSFSEASEALSTAGHVISSPFGLQVVELFVITRVKFILRNTEKCGWLKSNVRTGIPCQTGWVVFRRTFRECANSMCQVYLFGVMHGIFTSVRMLFC